MRKPNLQQVFNKVWRSFVIEGRPSGFNRKTQTCVYSGLNGKIKCAIGVNIPEPLLTNKVKRLVGGVYDLFIENRDIEDYFSRVPRYTLQDLQYIHDDAAQSHSGDEFTKEIERRLRKLAMEEGS